MTKISDLLRRKFPFQPTACQNLLFDTAGEFLCAKKKRTVLLVNGYAGTGKTSIIDAFIKVIPQLDFRLTLLAPTSRTAKEISQQSKYQVTTIYKKIYKAIIDPETGGFKFKKQKNFHKSTVFIVDEASMLNDDLEFGSKGLFTDLVEFVFEHETNKLILIGDKAQLPPLGKDTSPALCRGALSEFQGLQIFEVELKEVFRQGHSGILYNATKLRDQINSLNQRISFHINGHNDIKRINGEHIEGALRYAFDMFGVSNTVIICRSNNLAVKYNDYIRKNILFYDEEVEVGDVFMITRNNYFHRDSDVETGFLANGDFVEVGKVLHYEEIYGNRFATLSLKLLDYPNQQPFEAKVILNTLHAMTPSLPLEDYRKLYWEVNKDYQHIGSKQVRTKAVLADPYMNALHIKFAYALTAHKSQGGQWNCVFVDQGFLTYDMINKEFSQWLYTAITRSNKELYLVNFKATFFNE